MVEAVSMGDPLSICTSTITVASVVLFIADSIGSILDASDDQQHDDQYLCSLQDLLDYSQGVVAQHIHSSSSLRIVISKQLDGIRRDLTRLQAALDPARRSRANRLFNRPSPVTLWPRIILHRRKIAKIRARLAEKCNVLQLFLSMTEIG